ncbi:hypothetical protein Zmor_007435 [Zophobas morio]|uniref:Ricin B lectin domain-containing protein n=1 Tax=Zophobas morio TaxID=2755281 RepID=A0AA38MNK1_9CUCU|nr:hypothetical protein Zmor_007435 [Zophobas morio]
MTPYKKIWYFSRWLLLLPIFYTFFGTASGNCDQLYFMKSSTHPNFAVDGSDPMVVKIQTAKDDSIQKWQFVGANHVGLFHIFNNDTGTVLEEDLNNCVLELYPYCRVRLSPLESNKHVQKWFLNSNGTITNAYSLQNLDIYGRDYEPGTEVITYRENLGANQLFKLEETS